MEITKLHGVCTALVTPFKNQKIDKEMLCRLVERQINNGITALVLAGTTGEAPTLTDEEKQEMIHMVKSYVGKDTLVFAGTGTNSTERSVTLSKDAKEAGADGLLIVSPYYNKGNPDRFIQRKKQVLRNPTAIAQFFQKIQQRSDRFCQKHQHSAYAGNRQQQHKFRSPAANYNRNHCHCYTQHRNLKDLSHLRIQTAL